MLQGDDRAVLEYFPAITAIEAAAQPKRSASGSRAGDRHRRRSKMRGSALITYSSFALEHLDHPVKVPAKIQQWLSQPAGFSSRCQTLTRLSGRLPAVWG
jgi:hypothetical protein